MLEDKIKSLLNDCDVMIYNYLEAYYKSQPKITKSRAHSYSAIIRHHLQNAHTYIRLGDKQQGIDEVRNAKTVLDRHNNAEYLRYQQLHSMFLQILNEFGDDEPHYEL